MRERYFTAALAALALAGALPRPGAADVLNYTGLPLYPNLNSAAMDPRMRTDTLGHWCSRLIAQTSDPPDKVEAWYRRTWSRASDVDLVHDKDYNRIAGLTGVKLAVGIDSVTVYRVSQAASTAIVLSRCSH